MQEDAFLVPTLPEIRKIPALRHAVVVEPVQKVAGVALFAETAEPVLAYDAMAAGIWTHVGRRHVRLRVQPEHGVDIHIADVHNFSQQGRGVRPTRAQTPASATPRRLPPSVGSRGFVEIVRRGLNPIPLPRASLSSLVKQPGGLGYKLPSAPSAIIVGRTEGNDDDETSTATLLIRQS